MSILETNKIDVVAVRPDTNIVKLVVTDHLDWADFEGHASLLQEKLNNYISYCESGQLKRTQSPAIPTDPEVVMVLAVPEAPRSEEAVAFLDKVRAFLEGAGYGFEIDVRGK